MFRQFDFQQTGRSTFNVPTGKATVEIILVLPKAISERVAARVCNLEESIFNRL